MKTDKIKFYIIIIALLLLLYGIVVTIMFVNKGETLANLKAQNNYLNQKNDSLTNAAHVPITTQQVVQTTDAGFVKSEAAKEFDLKAKDQKRIKAVKLFVKAKQSANIKPGIILFDSVSTWIRSDGVTAEDYGGNTVNVDLDNFNNHYLYVPKSFTYDSLGITISGQVTMQGVQIDSIKATNNINFSLDEVRPKGFLKAKRTEIKIMNTNPVFIFTGTNSVQVKPTANAWNRWIKPAVIFVGTAVLTYKVTH